jgi:branched-subunit amino acid transport protein
MTAFVVILIAGLGSYLFRISMVALVERVRLPERLEQATAFVAPAAFAALAATGVAAASVGADLAAAAPPLAAVAAAVLAVQLTGRSYAAVLAGMPTLWALTALVGG